MEEILMVFNRLSALLEQFDSADQTLGQIEMQLESLKRITGGSINNDLEKLRGQTVKGLQTITDQKKAIERSILDLTGLEIALLRDRVLATKVLLERAGDIALEEKRVRVAFEILAEADSFAQDEEGESRKDYEDRLTQLRRLKETAMGQLVKLANASVNKNPIVGAGEGILKELHSRSINV